MLIKKPITVAAELCLQQRKTLSACQTKLFKAMLINDHATMSKMYHEKLVFTNATGHSVGKEPELNHYRAGNQLLTSIIPLVQQIEIWGTTAVVTVETKITGAFARHEFTGNFRYQHIWRKFRQEWKVISGCCVQVI